MQLEQTLAKELAIIVNERIDERIANCLNEVKRIIAELPRPERGERGEKGERGEIGPRGETGLVGRDGLPGLPGRDGKDGLNGKDGSCGPAGKDGKDGADGLGFEDMELLLSDDGCSVIERYARGNVVKELKRRFRGRHRGPWKHGAEYYLDDSVVCDNSSWIAMVDYPKKKPGDPGSAAEWSMYARRGPVGRTGERGPPGPQGPAGKDAAY